MFIKFRSQFKTNRICQDMVVMSQEVNIFVNSKPRHFSGSYWGTFPEPSSGSALESHGKYELPSARYNHRNLEHLGRWTRDFTGEHTTQKYWNHVLAGAQFTWSLTVSHGVSSAQPQSPPLAHGSAPPGLSLSAGFQQFTSLDINPPSLDVTSSPDSRSIYTVSSLTPRLPQHQGSQRS